MKELNPYEQRQKERRQRYAEKAEQLKAQSSYIWNNSFGEENTGIPLGQPILVGHHSEKRHRAHLAKLGRKADQAVELGSKARHYANKAEAVGTGGISSLDPDAIEKLKAQLEKLEALHIRMKEHNVEVRKNKSGTAIPTYRLQYNKANIKRIKMRIEELEKAQEAHGQELETDNFTVKYEDGYIKFIFDGKPEDEVRSLVKKAAFKWSPRQMAWVRKMTTNATYSAKVLIKNLNDYYSN